MCLRSFLLTTISALSMKTMLCYYCPILTSLDQILSFQREGEAGLKFEAGNSAALFPAFKLKGI